jgi:hypothetical protein
MVTVFFTAGYRGLLSYNILVGFISSEAFIQHLHFGFEQIYEKEESLVIDNEPIHLTLTSLNYLSKIRYVKMPICSSGLSPVKKFAFLVRKAFK